MGATWHEDPLRVDIHAGELSRAMAESIAEGARQRIPQGMLSDGSGPQKPPRSSATLLARKFVKGKLAKKALGAVRVSADRDGIRGYDNGRLFAKRIKAIKQTHGKLQGTYAATLQLNPGKIADRMYAWLERETKDGVQYILSPSPGSPGERELNAAAEAMIEKMVG